MQKINLKTYSLTTRNKRRIKCKRFLCKKPTSIDLKSNQSFELGL